MRALRVAVIALLIAGALVAPAIVARSQVGDASLHRLFTEANELYEAGDYAGAIERYESLARAGVDDATLYYNTGNAYYKIDDLGKAVLNYERALRLSPRDEDARQNLSLVEMQLKDKQFVPRQNRLRRAVAVLHHNLSSTEMFLLASIGFFALCLLGIVFVFRETTMVTRLYRWFSLLSPGRLIGLSKTQDMVGALVILALFFATTALSAWSKIEAESRRVRAVVVAEEIPVFASPTGDATLEFRLHEGTRVVVETARPNWIKIQLPGGLDGWVEADSIERI